MQKLRDEMRTEVVRLQDDLVAKQARQAAEVRARADEEQMRSLEFESRQRLWALEQASIRQASIAKLRMEAEAKEVRLDAQQREVPTLLLEVVSATRALGCCFRRNNCLLHVLHRQNVAKYRSGGGSMVASSSASDPASHRQSSFASHKE